jgi:tRNA threonylcarbamoyladenosine biosynthesis protein TsaB
MSSTSDPGLATARTRATLLALDSSTERIAIGLCAGAREWTHEAAGGASASAALLPAILDVLSKAGITVRDLDAIAFGRGPGAFTGVRTACSVVQGLAFGAEKPVLPLDTLLAVAEDARERCACTDVWVAMDARMEEVYAGHYVHADAAWHVLDAPALHTIDALVARWRVQPPLAVAGSALTAFGERLQTGGALAQAQAWPSAQALLRLARAAWAQGRAVDVGDALPLYLRDKVALTTVERDALKAAKLAKVDT